MTRQECGRMRAQALTLEQRRAMQARGVWMRKLLHGLGKSDGKPSPSPLEMPYKVTVKATVNGR
jgi:hypothetical protein